MNSQVSMSLSMTPMRTKVLEAVRIWYKKNSGAEGSGTFTNKDIREIDPDLTTGQVTSILRYFVDRMVLSATKVEAGIFTFYMFSVRDIALISNGPKDRHAIADKLLLLQGMRAALTGRPLEVLSSIIEDYENQL